MTAFAKNLGYTPETHLAEYRTCWGIFPTKCGQVVYYTTSLSREEVQTKINNLTSLNELPTNSDGYTLLDINLVTNRTLSIDGMVDSRDRTRTPEPLAYEWLLTEKGEDWVVTFYEIANDRHVYKIDGRSIAGNIITIMMITK